MRIINGTHRGRRITAPKNIPSRPTTDMAKEALFNMLNNTYYIEDLKVLDLFSGTGNIGYEFSSRGAKSVTAVELNRHCCRFIEKTIEELDLTQMNVVKMDVLSFLERHQQKYDVIYADPPYDYEQYPQIIEFVFKNELLNEDGMLILEHDQSQSFEAHERFDKHKRYGHVNLSFLS